MAESHSARPVVLHSSVGDFELQETVHYPNGGSSYFYACVDVAAIVDEGICEADNPDQVFDYSLITNKQNEYIASYDRVYRFLVEDTDRLEWCLEAQNGELDAFEPRRNSDRANLAEASPLERDFEEHFAEVYGPDSVRCLWREYGIVDLNGSTRYLDYLVKTGSGDIAVEVNGVTYHHPQRIGPEKYRSQLLKQNSCAVAGIKLYRFSSEDCQFAERLEDDIRVFFGSSADRFLDSGLVADRAFALYEHQETALEEMARQRKLGTRSFLAVFPTASGKTRIIEEDMRRFAAERGGIRALVLVPTRQIREDWLARIETSLTEYANSIHVRSYAFIERHYAEYPADYFDYIVVDEAHHAVAPGLKRTIQYFDPVFLAGLTATDQRPDKKKLEEVFGAYRVGLSLKEAMAKDIVAHANVFRVETNIDLSHVRINGKEYVNADLEKTIRVSSRNELIVDVLRQFFCEGAIARRQGVVFCVNVEHAQEMERLLCAGGISAKAYHGGCKNPEAVMRDFRAGKHRFLCACQMISEGWDYPELGILVMARPTLSKVLYLQQLGRGLRRTSTKHNVFVIDVVDEYGAAVIPCSLHSVFANRFYVPFGDILRTDYKPGEIVSIDGLVERVEKITEIDIFSFAERYGDFLSVEQLARRFFVSTSTVNSWVKKGLIDPTASFAFGSKKVHLFSPGDAAQIQKDLHIAEHTDDTIRDDFFAFLAERDYSLSYKMPFLLGFLNRMDGVGDARIEDVLDDYIAFYQRRVDKGLPVDRPTCPYNADTLQDREYIQRNMLANPFEKFERKRFLYHSKDLGLISINHALLAKLTGEDLEAVRRQMEDDLVNYYAKMT